MFHCVILQIDCSIVALSHRIQRMVMARLIFSFMVIVGIFWCSLEGFNGGLRLVCVSIVCLSNDCQMD